MKLFKDIQDSIIKYSDRNAFFINEKFYKYSELASCISRIRKSIQSNTTASDKIIALIANVDLETYAAIIALWFEGKGYVPIAPDAPEDRNKRILKQAEVTLIIDSSPNPVFFEYKLIRSKELTETEIDLSPKNGSEDDPAYILFTSGTTGQPKGVPLTRKNLTGFVDAFWDIGFDINENDKVLQMFELLFDLSVMSYLIPILKGACTYLIPKDKIKFAYINELLDEHQLTVALMVPSILNYLRPYFGEINAPSMKYSLFAGEALPLDIIEEWSKCIPNAEISNVYGPTEGTIFLTYYLFNRIAENKSRNGILSIGKPMKGTNTIIINDDKEILPAGDSGQLCVSGIQITPGYLNNEEKNKEAFFYLDYNNTNERFYKTGDLCKMDEDGDIFYLGRIDFQTKIQGFRVELSEIEFHAKAFLEKTNVVVVALTDVIGNTELGMAIESEKSETTSLSDYLRTKLPAYMLPKHIQFINEFPLNINGKIDRNKIGLLFQN